MRGLSRSVTLSATAYPGSSQRRKARVAWKTESSLSAHSERLSFIRAASRLSTNSIGAATKLTGGAVSCLVLLLRLTTTLWIACSRRWGAGGEEVFATGAALHGGSRRASPEIRRKPRDDW